MTRKKQGDSGLTITLIGNANGYELVQIKVLRLCLQYADPN